MDGRVIPWLKLNNAVSAVGRLCALLDFFGSAQAILSASRRELLFSRCVDGKTADAILSADEKAAVDTALICKKNGWSVITPESVYYPPKLRELKDYPIVLFCGGDAELLVREPKISVVGTRSPSDKGLMAAYLLGGCLSSLGAVTVSGGAVGIDAAAHEGALTGNGGTIAVLGCGLGADYLPQNSFMRRRIEKNGLLVSEFPPFTEPSKYSFPRRNRIIAALSDVTVVTESGIKGGSLITADYAAKQGKKVFCFASDIVSSPGCAQLVKNGAGEFSVPRTLLENCRTEIKPEKSDEKYLDFCLKNDGIHGVHIIKPSTMTADSFAAYNGITPAQARSALGGVLKKTPPAAAPAGTTVPAAVLPGAVSTGAMPSGKGFSGAKGAVLDEEKEKTSSKKEQQKKENRQKSEKKAKKNKQKNESETGQKSEPENEQGEKQTALPPYLSKEALTVLAALEKEPRYPDEIQHKISLSAQEVLTAITELELEGLAALYPGGRVGKI